MKVKLKTWEKFEKEFRPNSYKWHFDYFNEKMLISYKNYTWNITKESRKYFGKEIEVKKIKGFIMFTHESRMNELVYLWHDSWFEPEDFIKEEEFKV